MTAEKRTNTLQFDELLTRASKILDKERNQGKPTIAVWGLMNAGKSYLLNMLTEHFSSEYFPTKDVRETAALKDFEGEKYIFLDTPGLDANNLDDLIAWDGAAIADIVLFVHQPQGELESIEIDFLKKLKESFGKYAEKNIILIISKADVESKGKIDEIEAKVLAQCDALLNFKPLSFQVSGTRFHKGIQQHKEGLVRASHIDALQQHLVSLEVDVHALRATRRQQAIVTITEDLNEMEASLLRQKQSIENELKGDFSSFNQLVSSFVDNITKTSRTYSNI